MITLIKTKLGETYKQTDEWKQVKSYHIQNVKPMIPHFAQCETSSQSRRETNNSRQPSTVHHSKLREKSGPHIAPTEGSRSTDAEEGLAAETSSITACVPM